MNKNKKIKDLEVKEVKDTNSNQKVKDFGIRNDNKNVKSVELTGSSSNQKNVAKDVASSSYRDIPINNASKSIIGSPTIINKNLQPEKDKAKQISFDESDDEEKNDLTKHKIEKIPFWRKKWFNWTIILVILSGLGVGLGLHYGLGTSTQNNDICISNGPVVYVSEDGTIEQYEQICRADGLEDWIEDNLKENVAQQVSNLKNAAIIDVYNDFSNLLENTFGNGTADGNQYAEKELGDANKYAEDKIKNEKQDYMNTYGDNWELEWNKYLLSLGFDTEDQYFDSLVAQEIQSDLVTLYTGSGIFEQIPQSEISTATNHYVSTEKLANPLDPSNPYYLAIKNGKTNTGAVNTDNEANVEMIIDLYLQTNMPIMISDLLIPFTFLGAEFDGLAFSSLVFTDQATLSNIFFNIRPMIFANIDTYDGNYADNQEIITSAKVTSTFNFSELSTPSTLSYMTNLTLANQALTNAVLLVLVIGTNNVVNTNLVGSYDALQTVNLLWQFNYAIGNTLWAKDDHESTDDDELLWSGWDNNGGPVVGQIVDSPDDYAVVKNSLNAVSSSDFLTKITSNTIEDIGTYLANQNSWGHFLGGNPESNGTTFNYRTTVNILTINSISNVTSTGTVDNYFVEGSYLATVGSDGLHISYVHMVLPSELKTGFGSPQPDGTGDPIIYYYKDPNNGVQTLTQKANPAGNIQGIPVVGQRMIISDMNKYVEKASTSVDYADFVPDFGIIQDYNAKFSTYLPSLALNYSLSDPDFVAENSPGYDYQTIVNYFYNSFYIESLAELNTMYEATVNYYLKYSSIYSSIDTNALYTKLKSNVLYWVHDTSIENYAYKTISDMTTKGGQI